jgi:hypothetical protein
VIDVGGSSLGQLAHSRVVKLTIDQLERRGATNGESRVGDFVLGPFEEYLRTNC